MRHIPSVQDASVAQTDLVAEHDSLLGFCGINMGCLIGPVVRYSSLSSVSIRIALQVIWETQPCEKPPILIIADKVALYDILVSRPYSFLKQTTRIERQLLGDALDKGGLSVRGVL